MRLSDPASVEEALLPRVWPVFVVYAATFVAIVAASILAALVVHDLYPDLAPEAVLQGLPGLIAGAVASSSVLVLVVLSATRPLHPRALRLLPGREHGSDLLAMIVGTLAFGQALDSTTVLAGVAQQGTMAMIRRALLGTMGPELFNAVIVIGIIASVAEEVFFRGYMQTHLRARWPAWAAITATSVCFGLLHLEWLHASMAFLLGLYFGLLTEMSGSALPAVVCHVVNNVVFTLATALGGSVDGFRANVVLLVASVVVFVGCVAWLRASLASVALPPPAAQT